MKRFYIFALVAAMFAACTSNMTDEQAININLPTPETLIGTFEGDEMRIQLDNGKTVWTADDLVSVFYLSNANQKWQYQGETGERTGNLKQVEAGSATETMKRVVVVYPYNENYYINTDTYNVKGWLPAEQTYLADSYGLNGNIMISQSEYNQFSLKNVCGWLKLQLTGNGEKVQSIKLKGNNGEQVAGEVYINSADATASLATDMGSADDNDNSAGGNLVFEDTILTEVTLNCGDGVTLSAEPTAFYIGLPPQEFSRGLTVEVACSDGSTMTKSTEKSITIERNAIQPMAEFEFANTTPANNEIWYTNGSTTKKNSPKTGAFGANIVSHLYDAEKKCWVITFDGEVTSIGEDAFYHCTSLTSITIGDSVTEIGRSAFEDCTSLTSVTIGDSVTEIGDDAFSGCTSLTSVTIPDSVTSMGEGAFYNCTSLTSVTIGDSVTAIGESTFKRCYNLTNVTIGNNVKTISMEAFMLCESLKSITIPDSVTYIGYYAFEHCYALENVIIGNSVKTIDRYAFWDCRSLKSITIPDSVTFIGGLAFYQCTSLKDVYCMAKTPPALGENVFTDCASGIKFYVRIDSLDAYTVTWSKYAKSIIADYTPTECTSLTIEADDVPGYMTSTTIRYSAITNGVSFNRYHVMDIPITGEVTSSQFDMNTSLTDSVERTISFSYLGKSATTTIIQGPSLAKAYTVDLNNQWQISSVSNPDSTLYDGVYESFSNHHRNRYCADMHIDIVGYEGFTIYVRCDSEASYDYLKVYIDNKLAMTTEDNGSSDTSFSGYTEVKFNDINRGPHRIALCYDKDESDHEGADRAYVFIPKNQ